MTDWTMPPRNSLIRNHDTKVMKALVLASQVR